MADTDPYAQFDDTTTDTTTVAPSRNAAISLTVRPQVAPVPDAVPAPLEPMNKFEGTGVNPISGAAGFGQVLPSTYQDWLSRYGGANPWMPKSQTDYAAAPMPVQQRVYSDVIVPNEYAPALKRVGLPPTPGNLAVVNFLGPQGGPDFLAAASQQPDAPGAWFASPGAVANNRNVFIDPSTGKPRTAAQVVAFVSGGGAGGASALPRPPVPVAEEDPYAQFGGNDPYAQFDATPQANSAVPQDQPWTWGGLAGAVTRGLAPVATGTGIGAGAGALLGGVGAIPGAFAGATAAGLSELATSLGGLPTLSDATNRILTGLGVRQPSNDLERMVESTTAGGASAVGPAGWAGGVADAVKSPVTRGVLQTLAENPGKAALSGSLGGLDQQAAAEAGAGPFVQQMAGLAGGASPYILNPAAVARGSEAAGARAPYVAQQAQVDAQAAVARRLSEELASRGMSVEQFASDLGAERDLGKPISIVDQAQRGGPVRGLAGATARVPGEGNATFAQFFSTRDKAGVPRLISNVREGVVDAESADRVKTALRTEMKAKAKPLYEKAMEGGSMAPLEEQFTAAWNEASAAAKAAGLKVQEAKAAATLASAKQARAGEDVYLNNVANQEFREAQMAMYKAERVQVAAEEEKQRTLEAMQAAQNDAAAGKPGAVWSPGIRDALELPDVKRGLARGLREQRNEAYADGERFDPTEYAIELNPDGSFKMNEDGSPVVGKVPNMRLLDSAKKGLDAIIETEGQSEFGGLNSLGRSVYKVKLRLLDEIDKINPAYKEARDTWAGDAASMNALKFGRSVLGDNLSTTEVEDIIGSMSESERQFAKVGAASKMIQDLKGTVLSGDESKKLLNSYKQEEKLSNIFDSADDFIKFRDRVLAERKMFDAGVEVMAGSQTAARQAADEGNTALTAGVHGAKGIAKLASGNLMGAASSMLKAKRDLGLRTNQKLNAEIANILTDLNIAPVVGKKGKITFERRSEP